VTARNPTFVIDHSQRGERNDQERSDIDFYQGASPHGIYNRFEANNRGLIGDDVNTWPTTGGLIRIGHHTLPSMSRGKASNQGIPTSDEAAYIPAWAIGDPR
jgi:hypothetical protein